jgi:ACS family hexuronate transporter-like MFS transporter
MLVFTLASALSFLDRQVLAALAPQLRTEFRLTNEQYGYVVSAFSICYALTSPAAGILIDRIGLNRGISLSVTVWSLASIATGFVTGFAGLLGCRAWLGIAESGSIPANGKATAMYLLPRERAIGSGIGQIGISIGLVVAPVLATSVAAIYGWRGAFVVAGCLGFLWVPAWFGVSRWIPPSAQRPADRAFIESCNSARTGAALCAELVESATEIPAQPQGLSALVRDKRLWGLVMANVLSMTIYSLWMNWTTVFLVKARGLTQDEANLRFAWIPPVFAALGGMAGGALSFRLATAGVDIVTARLRGVLVGAIALLATAAAPHLPSTALVTAAVCWSFFWSVAMSVNLYALPLDYFGAARAATGVSALTSAYGFMQTFLSPWIGRMVDQYGFSPVCAVLAVLPLGAWIVLKATRA